MKLPKHTLVAGVISSAEVWREIANTPDLPCDLIELRLDALPREDRLIAQQIPAPKPLLLTPRHKSEGGCCDWDDAERSALAMELLPLAAALDWEIARLDGAAELLAAAKRQGVLLVASAHFFDRMPSLTEMQELEASASAAGADIVKIAFTPKNETDMAIGDDFLRLCSMPAAIMGMGALAATSRARYTRQGSALLYGYLGHTPTAPGQLSAHQCRLLTQAHS